MNVPTARKQQGLDPIGTLLSRLDGLRQTAPDRWIARCPSHEDRTPSLAITAGADGRVLIYDHGGCETLDIVHSVGLELADLFTASARHEHRGATRHSARISASDLLAIIDREALVVLTVAVDLLEQRTISEAAWLRLAQAVHRIGRARDHAVPARVSGPRS